MPEIKIGKVKQREEDMIEAAIEDAYTELVTILRTGKVKIADVPLTAIDSGDGNPGDGFKTACRAVVAYLKEIEEKQAAGPSGQDGTAPGTPPTTPPVGGDDQGPH
jgi:hypothetical protein